MKYFRIAELCRSATAANRHIDNTPSEEIRSRLESLIVIVLDPLREAYGKPIYVNSGYRSPRLNLIVGGKSNSQHLRGEAADITTGSRDGNIWLYNYIKNHLPYDQLIDEQDYSWIHVSYKVDGGNRHQVLKSE
jgi:hypothetical protein